MSSDETDLFLGDEPASLNTPAGGNLSDEAELQRVLTLLRQTPEFRGAYEVFGLRPFTAVDEAMREGILRQQRHWTTISERVWGRQASKTEDLHEFSRQLGYVVNKLVIPQQKSGLDEDLEHLFWDEVQVVLKSGDAQGHLNLQTLENALILCTRSGLKDHFQPVVFSDKFKIQAAKQRLSIPDPAQVINDTVRSICPSVVIATEHNVRRIAAELDRCRRALELFHLSYFASWPTGITSDSVIGILTSQGMVVHQPMAYLRDVLIPGWQLSHAADGSYHPDAFTQLASEAHRLCGSPVSTVRQALEQAGLVENGGQRGAPVYSFDWDGSTHRVQNLEQIANYLADNDDLAHQCLSDERFLRWARGCGAAQLLQRAKDIAAMPAGAGMATAFLADPIRTWKSPAGTACRDPQELARTCTIEAAQLLPMAKGDRIGLLPFLYARTTPNARDEYLALTRNGGTEFDWARIILLIQPGNRLCLYPEDRQIPLVIDSPSAIPHLPLADQALVLEQALSGLPLIAVWCNQHGLNLDETLWNNPPVKDLRLLGLLASPDKPLLSGTKVISGPENLMRHFSDSPRAALGPDTSRPWDISDAAIIHWWLGKVHHGNGPSWMVSWVVSMGGQNKNHPLLPFMIDYLLPDILPVDTYRSELLPSLRKNEIPVNPAHRQAWAQVIAANYVDGERNGQATDTLDRLLTDLAFLAPDHQLVAWHQRFSGTVKTGLPGYSVPVLVSLFAVTFAGIIAGLCLLLPITLPGSTGLLSNLPAWIGALAIGGCLALVVSLADRVARGHVVIPILGKKRSIHGKAVRAYVGTSYSSNMILGKGIPICLTTLAILTMIALLAGTRLWWMVQGSWVPQDSSNGVRFVSSGSFTMGKNSAIWFDQGPPHVVTIDNDLLVGMREVTTGQAKALLGTMYKSVSENPDSPAVNLTWFQAIKYCNNLSFHDGLPEVYDLERSGKGQNQKWILVGYHPERGGWRLPHEAEWEYLAYRGTSAAGSEYPTGFQVRIMRSPSNDQPDLLGLYGIPHGVREWCFDVYETYNTINGLPEAWTKSAIDDSRQRVVRGGSWNSEDEVSSITYRSSYAPRSSSNDIGLRVVRTFYH